MSALYLFEDGVASRFLPLTWTRPLFDLRCGIWTLREAIERAYGMKASGLFVRDFLAPAVRERSGLPVNEVRGEEGGLLLNGRLLANEGLAAALPMQGPSRRFVAPDGTLLGAWLEPTRLDVGWERAIERLPAEERNWPLLEWPWELFQRNGDRIRLQAGAWSLGEQPPLHGVYLVVPEAIYIHPLARIQPGVVLDATSGPIIVDEGAVVMAQTAIQGPTYVGKHATVKMGARIYHGTTIGPVCKVGGEVEETIFHGYSNKQHDGFLGHAYVGEWCNFGANSTNSDLKNNYSPVSLWVDGCLRNTGSLLVGLFMGDHSKTGITSMLNSGTVVGVACNLFGGGLPPKFLPSFSWGGGTEWVTYRLEEALRTAERVMARRDVRLSEAERALLVQIFEATEEERAAWAGGSE